MSVNNVIKMMNVNKEPYVFKNLKTLILAVCILTQYVTEILSQLLEILIVYHVMMDYSYMVKETVKKNVQKGTMVTHHQTNVTSVTILVNVVHY